MKSKIILLSTLAIISCTREIDAPTSQPRPGQGDVPVTVGPADFAATADEINRTWTPETTVSIYDGISENPILFTVNDIDGASCVLKGEASSDSDIYFALYPSDGFSSFAEGVVEIEVPAAQALPDAESSRARKISPSAAFAHGNQLVFSPFASYLKINLNAENVKSVTLSGAADENLTGTYKSNVYEPGVISSETVAGSIVFTPSGETFARGIYYIQVMPGTYEGVNVVLTYADNSTYSGNRYAKPFEIGIGEIQEIGQLKDEPSTVPAVEVSKVAFSSATLTWVPDGVAASYNIYVNDAQVGSVAGDVGTYALTGLATGAESTVAVEAVYESKALKSDPLTLKTAGVRVIGAGRKHVTIEWDEVGKVYNNTTGNTAGTDRGYYIGIYEDPACENELYELCPYNGLSKDQGYVYGNSSYVGQKSGKPYYAPTRLALGALAEDKTYYVRVRTCDDFKFYMYQATTQSTITHQFGNSEWSAPLQVKTLPAHVQEDNEVVFADFDDIACGVDRKCVAPGTLSASRALNDYSDMRAVPLGLINHSTTLVQMGIAEQGTASDNNYFTGAKFTVNGATNNNFIIKDGYAMAGWHIHDNVRPSMGAVVVETAQNRMVGTPALERNLTDTPTECILTFDNFCFRNGAAKAKSAMVVYLLRDGALTKVESYDLETSYESWTSTTDYMVGYSFQTKTVNLSLKKGDVVLVATGVKKSDQSGYPTHVVIDNIKIVTK